MVSRIATGSAGNRLERIVLILAVAGLAVAGCTGSRGADEPGDDAPQAARAGEPPTIGNLDGQPDGLGGSSGFGKAENGPDGRATPQADAAREADRDDRPDTDPAGSDRDRDDDGPERDNQSSPAQISSCAVGTWRSIGVVGNLQAGGPSTQLSGGEDIAVRISSDGQAVANYSDMEPISFSGITQSIGVKGAFRYLGSTSGRIRTDGGWRPAGAVNLSGTRVTVGVETPIRARLATNTPLGTYLNQRDAQMTPVSRNVVNAYPLFRPGGFDCQGFSLTLKPADSPSLTWMFNRVD